MVLNCLPCLFLVASLRFSYTTQGGGPCNASGSTTLMCVVPNFTRLDSEVLMRNISYTKSNVSYTVRYGAAPGPDLRVEELTIDVRPNPVFKEDGSALSQSEFTPGVGGLLRITVSIILITQARHALLYQNGCISQNNTCTILFKGRQS